MTIMTSEPQNKTKQTKSLPKGPWSSLSVDSLLKGTQRTPYTVTAAAEKEQFLRCRVLFLGC